MGRSMEAWSEGLDLRNAKLAELRRAFLAGWIGRKTTQVSLVILGMSDADAVGEMKLWEMDKVRA